MRRSLRTPVACALGIFGVQAIVTAFGGVPGADIVYEVAPFLIPFAAAAACFDAWRNGAEGSRATWLYLGAGALAWGLGDVGFSIYGLLDIDPSGSFTGADVGYLMLIPFWALALVSHPSRSRRGLDRLGTIVDALTIVAVTATLTVAYILAPTIAHADNAAGAAVVLAYPIGDLMLLAVLVSIRARSTDRLGTADMLIGSAAVVFAFGDIAFARLVTVDAYVVGNVVDLSWSLAFVLVALAAGRVLGTKGERDENRMVVPTLAILGIVGLTVLAAIAIATRLENTILLAGSSLTAILIVARLMTLLVDRIRILRSYDEKVEELEEAHRSRERFIATVSHDLRSPLASIVGFAELLRESDVTSDPDQVAMMTRHIESNARRLARMTEDLLCAGQFAAGHPPSMQLEGIDLKQLAELSIAEMGRGDVRVEGERWTYALADQQRMQQVIVNLVENAFKHSGASEVVISVTQDDDGPTIAVSDRGKGIPHDRISQIFQPFVSSFSTSSSAGLGLFVVQSLVSAMNGRISVTSELGAGTTFRIVLPPAVSLDSVVAQHAYASD